MDDAADLRRENAALRERNDRLLQQLADAQRAVIAASCSEVAAGTAEEALRRSRAMLEEAQAIAHVGSWSSGFLPDGTIEWSREGSRILGVPAGVPMAVTAYFELVHPEDRERFNASSHAAIHLGARADVEHRLLRPDGSVCWVHQRGVVERDANGRPIRFIGSIEDITERRQTEASLRESEQRLALATTSAGLGIWDWDVPRNTMLWDPQMYALYGIRAEDFTGAVDAWQSGLHPEDRAAAQADLDAALGGAKDFHTEFRVVWPSGEVRSLEAHGLVERGADGSPSRMIGVNWDITARKRAEEALRASEEELHRKVALLRTAGHAVQLGGWSVSLAERRVTWSDEVFAIHEVAPGTTPGLEQAFDYYAPECREIIRERFEACARDGRPFDVELQIITAKGRRVWVRAIGDAVRDGSGTVSSVQGAFQDIDERRRLQDQFRQSQKMEAVGRLAGGIAHDFNNLLSVILSYADLMRDGISPNDPLRADLKEIEAAGQRGTTLVRQLLAYSRQQVLQPRVLDLPATVASMRGMLARLLGEDVSLNVSAAEGIHPVLADPGQIEQVVMNLAVNARDAMPRGGTLTLEITNVQVDASVGELDELAPGEYAMLAVVDTGVGMDTETRLQIFEPFFTTKGQGKGTGLGLATVFGIVRQSGGFIRVYSELGHGTAFKIYLPRTDRRGRDLPSAPSTPTLRRGSETILLVEDEAQLRTVAATILRRNGYDVLEASNGGEAFLISRELSATIHLLLTDVVMPRMSGRKLAEELAPQRPLMKVLFASGYTDDAIVHHGVLEAGVAFLQKPFTPDALLRKVREVLDGDGRGAARG